MLGAEPIRDGRRPSSPCPLLLWAQVATSSGTSFEDSRKGWVAVNS